MKNSYQKANKGIERIKDTNLDRRAVSYKIYNCYKELGQ
jgi:hypothetical protein